MSRKAPPCDSKPPLKVIFDTNAYRVLTYGLDLEHSRAKALQIRNAEAQYPADGARPDSGIRSFVQCVFRDESGGVRKFCQQHF